METQTYYPPVVEPGASQITTDHETIRRWIETRGGTPAVVRSVNGGSEPGLLRVQFRGYRGNEWLEPITWEAFFQRFEDEKLVFHYQDQVSDGTISRFCQFVNLN